MFHVGHAVVFPQMDDLVEVTVQGRVVAHQFEAVPQHDRQRHLLHQLQIRSHLAGRDGVGAVVDNHGAGVSCVGGGLFVLTATLYRHART